MHDLDPDSSAPNDERDQKAGHHGHREDQDPDLRRIIGQLQADKIGHRIESDDGAVLEPHVLTETQVDALHPLKASLSDHPRIQREDGLRPARVHSGITFVNVHRHRGVIGGGKCRREKRAVKLLCWGQQPFDGDLILAAFVGIGKAARGRIKPHRTRRQQCLQILGLPLQCLSARLPVGERHGERRGVSVPEQVQPHPTNPERIIDLQSVGLPDVGSEFILGLVVDIGSESHGLAVGQKIRREAIDAHAHREQLRAVDCRARPECVESGGRSRTEPRAAVGDDDDIALVAVELAGGQRHQQADQ